ncbi:MAG: polyribonucleotide nucleotidyltransferase [Candidatus Dojkabacteria bacterium]|nr:MAG: polyribonucleotide nucleotidyltransferase [Candidatus Dojkabacteria bacterium]
MTSHTITLNGKEIILKSGQIAPQALGRVIGQIGGTTVLGTVTVDDTDSEMDYFPLGVEYIEKMYARGVVSGSRFQKREGFPGEDSIIKARQVDHSIRSLFPKSFKKPTSVVLTVLSYDEINDPENLSVLVASMALIQSGIPFMGPASSVVVGVTNDDEIIINPDVNVRHDLKADFVVSGVDDKVLNLEGWAKEIPEELMDKVLDKSMESIKALNQFQREFAQKINTPEVNFDDYSDLTVDSKLIDYIKNQYSQNLKEVLFVPNKIDREKSIKTLKQEIIGLITAEESPVKNENNENYSENEVQDAIEYVLRYLLRKAVIEENKRISGRDFYQIRDLHAEVDVLPVVHGSAFFSRGLTQCLSIVTLAPKSYELLVDDMMGEYTKTFMHHYNMPNFSTGEAGRYNYRAGRREIGHGAIGENALKNLIPSADDFPYTIRVVSEILSSNGSTSMAATCASSMALMAAGVPLKEAVAGIGVGLVIDENNETNYKLLLDIEGTEDFYGDMDFKVCGTKNGITAIQYENKIRGVRLEILKEAFRLARKGRLEVLEVMNQAISQSRSELPKNAPVVEKIQIEQDQIGELIGPGGKTIKELVESSRDFGKVDADIAIEDDGSVLISAANSEQLEYVKDRIQKMFETAKLGAEYEVEVEKVADFGLFVRVPKTGIQGLVHISEITDKYIGNLSELFKEGDRVNVLVKSIEGGKVSMTMKGLMQPEEIENRLSNVSSKPNSQKNSHKPNRNRNGFGNKRGFRRN